MNNYLVDTTVIIDHLRGNLLAKQFLEKNNPSISMVTMAELIQGARDKQELSSVIKLGTNLSQIDIDKKISKKSIALLADFHLSHGLLFLDALIAATAIENNLVLITKNTKHFRFIKELEVLSQEKAFTR